MSRRLIAVYDTATGKIKQVVKCFDVDAGSQHQAFPGHHFVDVTDHPEEVKARSHAIDLKTRKPIPWFDLELARREKLIEIENAHHSEEIKLPNEAALVSDALLGGDAEKKLLHDHVAARKERQSKREALHARINAAPDSAALSSIKWPG